MKGLIFSFFIETCSLHVYPFMLGHRLSRSFFFIQKLSVSFILFSRSLKGKQCYALFTVWITNCCTRNKDKCVRSTRRNFQSKFCPKSSPKWQILSSSQSIFEVLKKFWYFRLQMEENENELRRAMLTGDSVDRTDPKNQVKMKTSA